MDSRLVAGEIRRGSKSLTVRSAAKLGSSLDCFSPFCNTERTLSHAPLHHTVYMKSSAIASLFCLLGCVEAFQIGASKGTGDEFAPLNRSATPGSCDMTTDDYACGLTASSPDGHDPDYGGVDAYGAVDCNFNTYWDQNGGAAPHILQLDNVPAFSGYKIIAYEPNFYAPMSWTLVCDGATIEAQTDVDYNGAFFFRTCLESTFTCAVLQLRITSWYASSPGIREFVLYKGSGTVAPTPAPTQAPTRGERGNLGDSLESGE